MYIDSDLERELRALSNTSNLTKEQQATIKKVVELIDNEVYSSTYNKDDVVEAVIEYATGYYNCSWDGEKIEKKLNLNPVFFDEVSEALEDMEHFPVYSDFFDEVRDVFNKYYEVSDEGNLLYKGLTEN